MKSQALFSSKDKSKKLKCRLLQFFFWTLRVNESQLYIYKYSESIIILSKWVHFQGKQLFYFHFCLPSH